MTTLTSKCFYATTRIFQGDTEFSCHWDWAANANRTADNICAIAHLNELLGEAEDAFQETYEEGDEINFYGMSPQEFATFLVENEEEAKEKFATTWEIKSEFQEVDAEWEHPCNL